MNDLSVQTEISCVKCHALLIAECSASTGGVRVQSNGGFFHFDCPLCGGHNAAVKLAGDDFQRVFPNPKA